MKLANMNRLIGILLLLVVSSLAELPKGWSDLFVPPYENTPTVMIALGCVDGWNHGVCYIPAGSNGVGFDVFQFDGEPNGNFNPLNMPDMDLMMMAIGVGGSADSPKGATGGMGFGDSIQYFINATTLMPSSQPFMVVTQDIRATKDGSSVLVVNQGMVNQAMWSSNSGENFTAFPISSPMPSNETFCRYGAIADNVTWFITLGNWPGGGSSSNGQETHLTNHDIRNMQRRRPLGARMADPYPVGYTCVIAKTTDGGWTWHNVMYEATNYYPNGIDCWSPTHCIAVGEGFNEKAGAHIWVSSDGMSFQTALHMKDNTTGQYSFMSIRFVSDKEAWVGGSYMQQSGTIGIFFSTTDGGYTWTEHRDMPYLGEITDISFTATGYGFATAITMFDTSTVLRYDPSGPPRTPAPTWLGNFTQVSCIDNNCSVNCSSSSFPQDICLPLNGGGTAIAQCQYEIIQQWVFPFSNNCTGLYTVEPMPLGQCLEAESGGSFENFCGPSQPPPKGPQATSIQKHRAAKRA